MTLRELLEKAKGLGERAMKTQYDETTWKLANKYSKNIVYVVGPFGKEDIAKDAFTAGRYSSAKESLIEAVRTLEEIAKQDISDWIDAAWLAKWRNDAKQSAEITLSAIKARGDYPLESEGE